MAQDRITEVTEVSWFSRIKSALGGIVTGIALIPAAMGLLIWNEGRAVSTARSLTEGSGLVVAVASDAVDPAHEGQLVHVSGPVTPATKPEDSGLGVTAEGLRLTRVVEMFQWQETSRSETTKNLGGSETTTTVYDYAKVWAEGTIDSTAFKERTGHDNPPALVTGDSFAASGGHLGAFALTADQLDLFGTTQDLPLDDAQVALIATRLGATLPVQRVDGRAYVGANPAAPALGDLRLSYRVAVADQGSVIAAQRGDGFAPFQTASGRSLFLSAPEARSADEMFASAKSANTTMTWGLRAAGILLLYGAFRLIFGVLRVIADVVPFVGSIVGTGLGLAAWLPTLVLGPLAIAIAWFAYRPIVGVACLAVAALAVAGFVVLSRRRTPSAPV